MTEFDMGAVREMFDNVLNTVANATQLAKDVDALRQQVEALSQEVSRLRDTNKWMDSQITELRKQRDDAIDEASKFRTEAGSHETHARGLESKVASLDEQVSVVCRQRDEARKERDDALFKNLQLEEENKTLKEKLGRIEELFRPAAQPPQDIGQHLEAPQEHQTQYDDPNIPPRHASSW